jgi:uncharacterized protein (TIGR03083 family)
MTDVDPRRSLDLLRPEVLALSDEIAALSPAQWDQDSNCGGWKIADLAAHAVRNGDSVLRFVKGALADDDTPVFGPAAAARQAEVKGMGPAGAAALQRSQVDELMDLVQTLDEAQLNKLGKHPIGPRTIAWMCNQRLVEVAVHRWDLQRSLGQERPMEAGLSSYLLAFMLDPELPSLLARPAAEGAAAETFRLTSTGDGTTWRVTAGPEGRRLEGDPAGPAGVEVAAEPGWLVPALYGRLTPAAPRFRVAGPPDAAARFAAAFGG